MRNSTLKSDSEVSNQNFQEQSHVWSNAWLPLDLVIKFPQVRKTFEKESLQELADDIAKNGLIQPPMIAKLSKENFAKYVEVFEKISKTKLLQSSYQFEETNTGEVWYHVLVAGERRYRAHMILWETGCTDCINSARDNKKTLEKGECFSKHFPQQLMESRVGINIDPEKAKSIQFRENHHVRPPAHEEAYGYRDYYDHLKTLNQKLTLKEFAERVGVSVEKVRRAIWFCELPDRLRQTVEDKMISYSNALELKRILQIESIGFKERIKIINNEVDFLLIHQKIKNEDYKKRVDNLISSFQMLTLFDTKEFEMGKKEKRKVVNENLLKGIILMRGYMTKLNAIIPMGIIGKGRVYSGISPTNQVKFIVEELQKIIPGFKPTKQQLEQFKKIDLDI